MNYDHLQDLVRLIYDVNPTEISDQISRDHLGEFCKNIKHEAENTVRKILNDGYCQATPVIHCVNCVNFKNGKCEEYGHLVPDDFYCGTGERRFDKL